MENEDQAPKKTSVWERFFWFAPILVLILPFFSFVFFKASISGLTPDGMPTTANWDSLPLNYLGFEWVAIFSSVAAFGSVGATVSYFSRSNDPVEPNRQSLQVTQLFGAVFASLLALMFLAGLLQGSLFPAFSPQQRWLDLNFTVSDWAKIMVWSFIAGFSERFVPNLLNNLIANAEADERSEELAAKAKSEVDELTGS